MALKEIFKVNRKTFFDPRRWLGYDAVRAQSKVVWNLVQSVFVLPRPMREETFEAAMHRLHVTDDTLQILIKNYQITLWIFLGLSMASVLLGIYMLVQHGTLAGFILALGMSIIFLSQAFKYSFWLFQIKHRKLGVTFEEWRKGKLNREE